MIARSHPIGPSPSIFRLQGVGFGYGRTAIFENVDFTAPPARMLGIRGASGSGKSTLLGMLGGVTSPLTGSVRVLGAGVPRARHFDATLEHRRRVAYVLQSGNLVRHQTAAENAALPLLLAGRPRRVALGEAHDALETLGLGDFARRRPGQLSGGQQQRVAVARALTSGARLVLADEPTAGLDPENERDVFEALACLVAEHGRCVVVVSHSLSNLERYADAVLRVEGGRVEVEGSFARTEEVEGGLR